MVAFAEAAGEDAGSQISSIFRAACQHNTLLQATHNQSFHLVHHVLSASFPHWLEVDCAGLLRPAEVQAHELACTCARGRCRVPFISVCPAGSGPCAEAYRTGGAESPVAESAVLWDYIPAVRYI